MKLLALFLYVLAVSAAVAMALTPLAERWSYRLSILDRPGLRKIHYKPMPLLGGAAILAAFSVVVGLHMAAASVLPSVPWLAAALPAEWVERVRYVHVAVPRLVALFAGGALVFAIGVADDARGLSVARRFVLELLVAVFVVVLGIRPDYGGVPTWILVPLSILWITGLTNAFNLIDSIDGLAAGIAVVAAAGLALLVGLRDQPLVAALLLALAGSIAGFLFWNRYPARVFLGSSGSMFAGYGLSVAFLFASFLDDGQPGLVSAAVPVLLLGLPLFDTAQAVVRRVAAGRSPFQGDRLHVAHQVMRLGLTQRQVAGLLHLVAIHGALSALLLSLVPAPLRGAVLGQAAIPYGVLLLLMRRRKQRGEERISVPWIAHLESAAEGEGAAGSVRLSDVAARGVGLTLDPGGERGVADAVEAGRGSVRLRTAIGAGEEPLRFVGRIRWSRRGGDGGLRAGIEIVEMDAADRARLESVLRSLSLD